MTLNSHHTPYSAQKHAFAWDNLKEDELTLSLRTSAHLTVLSLINPALNLTFSLLPITSRHPHASASDSTFDFWRYLNI